MSKTNLFSSRMARILVLSIIVFGVIALTTSVVQPVLSCPGPPPQPLRQLYFQSEMIVIARVGKSEITLVEDNDDNNDSNTTLVKTALHVSSTLKGEHQSVVYVDHYIYGDYKPQLSNAKEDETLLVFLSKIEGFENYDVDMNYGLKKLSDSDLAVYVSRIKELDSIMKSGTPSNTEIVEWLVRCAEEPATRWEGAYDLSIGSYLFEQRLDQNGQANGGEVSEDQNDVAAGNSEDVSEFTILTNNFTSGWHSNIDFAKLLTSEQKYRLTTALVNSKVLTINDYVLLEVVQRWDDQRLVPFLLAQLDLMSKAGQDEQMGPIYPEGLMTIVADKLGDDALKAMVEKYTMNEYGQADNYAYDEESGDQSSEATNIDKEQEEADEAAAIQLRNAELQHFVTLALSTVPKTPEPEVQVIVVSEQP